MRFEDRHDAGRQLAVAVEDVVHEMHVPPNSLLVLALPRGGVPVGFEVAKTLHAPLDVFLVRKLGAPGHEELAMGAIASGGVCLMHEEVVRAYGITPSEIDTVMEREQLELRRREQLYRGGRPPLKLQDKTVVLVDDGMATGYSMRAAIAALKEEAPDKIIAAVPAAARSTCKELEQEADAVVCLYTPVDFTAVGQWYRDFAQTSDEEVRRLLAEAQA